MRNLRALSLLLYIVSLFVIPVYHITEVSATASDCSACSEEKATSNQIAVTEKCEPDNPCHSHHHPHHNHHSHDHNCQLCQFLQNPARSPYQENSIGLALSDIAAIQHSDEIALNTFVLQSIDIRGPPTI